MTTVVLLKSRLSQIGGLEKYTRRLAEAFVKKGCRVKILTTGTSPAWDDIDVVSLGNTSKLSCLHLLQFDRLCQKWIKRYQPDIVFGMERHSYQTHYRAGSGVHKMYLKRRALIDSWPKQLSFKINPLHLYLLYLEKKTFESPDLKSLFTNSNMVKREILEMYAIDEKKIKVVHNGVEWKEKEEAFEKSFNLPKKRKKPFHFLFVGNGFKRKGLLFLIEGLKRLNHPFQLTVVGKDKNLAHYKTLTKNLNVCFVGAQKDVTSYYTEADALVLPSLYDPFSNVTLEALAMGLFVITSRYNGGSEVLQEESGIIVDDLTNLTPSLEAALKFPKTYERALWIRESIKRLDFSNQLDKIVSLSLC